MRAENSATGNVGATGLFVTENATKRLGEPGMTQDDMRERFVDLVFNGSRERFDQFCRLISDVVPAGTTVVVRGSGITGERWDDGAPFDADGPGTSDIDLTLVGTEALSFFKVTGYFVPGIHSRPLSDEDPDIAPGLVPLRKKLMALVGRPVNIQATRDIVMHLRGDMIGQPYLVLFEKPRIA